MNSLDFVSGIDFTGLPSVVGSDVNNAVANGTPLKEGADETIGRGLPLTTTDSAANIPVVPDPTADPSFTKFKRYIWIRRPFAGSATKSGKLYTWNDDAPNDLVYLKWVEVSIDLSAITALANNALATADNAVAVANVANNTATQLTLLLTPLLQRLTTLMLQQQLLTL